MLDTNVVIGCLRKKNSLANIVEQNGRGNDLAISAVTYGELIVGLMTNDTPRRRAALTKILSPISILDFDKKAATVFGKIKVELKKKPIGAYDLQIAAHAISEGYTLVTHNTKDFSRVEGLNIIDWEAK